MISIIAETKEEFDIEGVAYLGGEPTLNIAYHNLWWDIRIKRGRYFVHR